MYLIFMIISILLSSCSSFRAPTVLGIYSTHNKHLFKDGAHNYLPDDPWWKRFDDHQLNVLVNSAFINNNDIKMALANIMSANGQFQSQIFSLVPTFGVSFSHTTRRNFGSIPPAGGGTVFTPSGYSAGITPNYTQNYAQQIANIGNADYNVSLAIYQKDAVRLLVLSNVLSTYFSYLSLMQQIWLHKEIVNLLHSKLLIAKYLFDYGQFSFQQFKVQQDAYNTELQTLANLQVTFLKSKNSMLLLTNVEPNKVIINSNLLSMPIGNIVPANIPSTVLLRRPDVEEALINLKLARGNIAVAISSLFPQISLTGILGSVSNELSSLFDRDTDFWQFQMQLLQPIFNFAIIGNIYQAKGAYYNVYYKYIDVVRKAFVDVDNSLNNYQVLKKNYALQESSFLKMNALSRISNSNYTYGNISKLDMLSVQVEYLNSYITTIKLKEQLLHSIVSLYQSLGGGYNVGNINNLF